MSNDSRRKYTSTFKPVYIDGINGYLDFMEQHKDDTRPEQTYIEISYDIWISRWKPYTNDWDEVRMFETFGDDIAFIEKQDPNRVWTLIEEDENMCIVSGIRFVNRLGYYVTERARNPLDLIVVID